MAKTTEKTKVSSVTGLTETQERACVLLAGGEGAEEVAKALDVPEKTLFLWQRQTTFKCYYNKQRSVLKDRALQGVFGLVGEAVEALRESLSSVNEAVRLKAATYIIDKLQGVDLGATDITEVVKEEATSMKWGGDFFDEKEYLRRLSDLGIQEQDYEGTLK